MKRSEILDIIDTVIADSVLSAYVDQPFDRVREMEKELAEDVLTKIELAGMFYCPAEDLGDFGSLRTPKGLELE